MREESQSLTTNQLLAQILDAINQTRLLDVPSDLTRYRAQKLASGVAGTVQIMEITQFSYLYIPKAPRDLTIFYGIGRGQLLAAVATNARAVLVFPRMDGLTIEYGATGTDTLEMWFSTRMIGLQQLT